MALEGECESGEGENLARKISLTWYVIAVTVSCSPFVGKVSETKSCHI